MKWNSRHISLFFQIYHHYPALWNVKEKDYCNKSMRETLLDQLMAVLDENQLLGQGMDKKQLKSKIKSLKDVYRAELSKIDKSKKSGCGTDDVYVPKLTWFNDASYLSEVVTTRSSKFNWDPNQSQNSKQDAKEDPDETSSVGKTPAKRNTAHSSGSMKPPEPPRKRLKQMLDSPVDKRISLAIQKLSDIAHQCGVDKPFDQFGKYVAAELRQLPKRAAILLQQEIQNSITHSKLNMLDNESVQQDFDNYTVDYQSPESMCSVTGSSNDEEDILRTAQ